MKYFVLVLHFYQPPTQDLAITRQILESCYLPLLRTLDSKSNFKITLNMSGSLMEQLDKLKAIEFFALVKKLIADGKVELIHSVMYHSLLPLISDEMMDRAIVENVEIISKLLGQTKLVGFFPPELAIDQHTLFQIKDKVIFVNQKSIAGGPLVHFQDKFLCVSNQKLINLFRAYPNKLDVKKVFHYIQQEFPDEELFILPNDAELFGHHYAERLNLLADLLDSSEIAFISPQTAIERFGKKVKHVKRIKLASWQNTDDLNLWTKNKLQKKYLKFAQLAMDLSHGNSDPDVFRFLDKGWSSCYLYWLSNWPWWYPDIVESGAKNLIKSVRANVHLSNQSKAKAEKLYFSLLNDIWQYHWSDQVEKGYEEYDQSRDKKLLSFSGI